ncbi:geranylgeranyl reductase [Rhodovulum sp. P5]|uniref:geranylgeranyl reductase family protein n=1 Tax=Rhodovulum sp. P5 TaxID=1564506 RepID=UPI0009C37BB1|nr:NAD(P)/FAD-dependent oxidoreductase [Rhodovulum sp. P5]ARE39430.1 geranylgeranyl reductase [Rhodovulum sp. P5]
MSVDVLIVGLGPAGASAAAAAARAGARVLAVDRRAEPGCPVQCAEFVPAALAGETSAVARSAVQEIAAMETCLGTGAPVRTPDFRGVMIDRARFDAALVEDALAAGAEVMTGVALHGIDPDGTVVVADRTMRPRVVIGADGPRSTVGRLAGLPNRALAEARQITVPLLAPHDATDIFLSADIEGGYGWLFPRGEEANLGLGVVPHARDRLKPLLEDLHARLVRQGRVGETATRLTGGKIPVGGMVGPVGRIGPVEVLLAGDAAGLTHPITGAGIAAAVLSGRLAGEAAADMAAGRSDAADDYAEDLHDLYGPSLGLAVRQRQALMATYDNGGQPTEADLRRAWIAFPEYRQDKTQTPATEAKEPA